MEAAGYSETLANTCQTIELHIPEANSLHLPLLCAHGDDKV
jgi:hypothetical protein